MSLSRTTLLTALGGVLLIAAFWFAVLAPKHRAATDLRSQIDTTEAQVAQTRATAATLRAAKASHDVDYTSVVRLGKAVPADDDVRSLVVQLDTAAKRSGVDFRSIQLNGGTGTTATPPVTAGAATTQATTAALPPGATVGPAGFPTMPFSFEFKGKFFTLSNFFSRLERMVTLDGERMDVSGRLLTVDGFSLKAGQEGFPVVDAEIGATAYLLPEDQALPLGATPAAAAGATPAGATPATTPVTTPATGAIR